MLCCHSNATRAPIENPPNSAQLGGIPYHSKLHPGPCNSVGMRPRTDRQTHRRASSTTHAKCNHLDLSVYWRKPATGAQPLEIKRSAPAQSCQSFKAILQVVRGCQTVPPPKETLAIHMMFVKKQEPVCVYILFGVLLQVELQCLPSLFTQTAVSKEQ